MLTRTGFFSIAVARARDFCVDVRGFAAAFVRRAVAFGVVAFEAVAFESAAFESEVSGPASVAVSGAVSPDEAPLGATDSWAAGPLSEVVETPADELSATTPQTYQNRRTNSARRRVLSSEFLGCSNTGSRQQNPAE